MSDVTATAIENEPLKGHFESESYSRRLNFKAIARHKAMVYRTNATLSQDDISLQPRHKRQLYYPLILLKALNKSPGMGRRAESGAAPLAKQSPTQIFYDFVNRVALLCQTKTGGDAVSACTVLQHPSGVIYFFTSNFREDSHLQFIAAALTAILQMISLQNDSDDDETLELRQKILLKILSLVKPRIKCYFNCLGAYLENCIADCQRGNREKGIVDTTPRHCRPGSLEADYYFSLIDKILWQELSELRNLAGTARDLTGAGQDQGRTTAIHLTNPIMD